MGVSQVLRCDFCPRFYEGDGNPGGWWIVDGEMGRPNSLVLCTRCVVKAKRALREKAPEDPPESRCDCGYEMMGNFVVSSQYEEHSVEGCWERKPQDSMRGVVAP